jgi:hypothetical protein
MLPSFARQRDSRTLGGFIVLAPVWKGSMTRCRRIISSPDLEGWIIEDEGELEREGRVVFFLQSRHPFTGSGHEWASGKMRIKPRGPNAPTPPNISSTRNSARSIACDSGAHRLSHSRCARNFTAAEHNWQPATGMRAAGRWLAWGGEITDSKAIPWSARTASSLDFCLAEGFHSGIYCRVIRFGANRNSSRR